MAPTASPDTLETRKNLVSGTGERYFCHPARNVVHTSNEILPEGFTVNATCGPVHCLLYGFQGNQMSKAFAQSAFFIHVKATRSPQG